MLYLIQYSLSFLLFPCQKRDRRIGKGIREHFKQRLTQYMPWGRVGLVFLLFRVLDFLVLVVWCFGFFVWFFFVWGFFCLVSWFWFFLLLPQTFIPSSQRIPRKGDRFWFFMAVPMTCFSFSGSCTQVWLHPQCWFGQIHLAGEVGGCQERNSSFFLLLMHLCYLSDSYVKGDWANQKMSFSTRPLTQGTSKPINIPHLLWD